MKTNKITYWISTGLVTAGMLLSAAMYLTHNADLIESFKSLGMPLYFVTLLGVAKLAGAIVLAVPAPVKLKEWAYAGFAFTFVGAAWTHVATSTPPLAPIVFLILLGVSYVSRLRMSASAPV